MRYGAVTCCPFLFVVCLACATPGAGETAPSASAYEGDMAAFVQTIDDEYPFLALKGIADDWTKARPGLMQRARQCQSDETFLWIVVDAFRVLRDGHLEISETRVPSPASLPVRYYPGLSFLSATESRVVVLYAPRALAGTLAMGTLVTKTDGANAWDCLEQRSQAAWDKGGFFSSPQRARLFEYRLALCGERGQKHTIDSGEKPLLPLEIVLVFYKAVG